MKNIQFHMCFLNSGEPGKRKVVSVPLGDTGISEEDAAKFCMRFLDDRDVAFWLTIGNKYEK